MFRRILSVGLALVVLAASQPSHSSTAAGIKKYSPKGYVSGRCSDDPKAPKSVQQIQDYLSSRGRCVGAMYVPKTTSSKGKPTTKLTPVSDFADLNSCKIKQPSNLNEYLGFSSANNIRYEKEKHPAPGSVIQVVGIKGADTATPRNTPKQDYKVYLDFMKSWFDNINNSKNPVQIRVLNQYVDLGVPLAPFQIFHGETPENKKVSFTEKVAEAIDSLVDFTDVDYVIAVTPAGTKYSVINQDGFSGIKLEEGANQAFYVAPPATYVSKEPNKFANFQSPLMWIHELYHPGFNLGDSHGESIFSRLNAAMGEWGMMSSGTTDMIQWQKWLLGFTTDSQVICVNPSKSGTYWLAPGSTKSSKTKLAVMPISETEVVIVESVRGTGANFKLGQEEQGALVYTLDVLETAVHQAYKVQFPDTRVWKSTPQMMAEAPLYLKDSVVVKGLKITNVEWGEFGDVIKVEPVK